MYFNIWTGKWYYENIWFMYYKIDMRNGDFLGKKINIKDNYVYFFIFRRYLWIIYQLMVY